MMLADTHIILETPNPGIELVPAPFDWTLNVHKGRSPEKKTVKKGDIVH